MRTFSRPVSGWGMHNHQNIAITPGAPARPVDNRAAAMRTFPFNLSGPGFKGMDPSDPLTYVRPWNPVPGMIAQLNFDGASLQARTPTQLQRGPQSRPRKLTGVWSR